MRTRETVAGVVSILLLCGPAVGQEQPLPFPGPAPGKAQARIEAGQAVLENAALAVTWKLTASQLGPVSVADKLAGQTIEAAGEAFSIGLSQPPAAGQRAGQTRWLDASTLKVVGEARVVDLAADPKGPRTADHFAGKAIVVALAADAPKLAVEWRAELRDEGNAVRQFVTVRPAEGEVGIDELRFWNFQVAADGAELVGPRTWGSPVVAGNLIFACEHPRSLNTAEGGAVQCRQPVAAAAKADRPIARSAMVAVVPAGQLRRGFLYYVERERPRPYQPFLHWNSWFTFSGNIQEKPSIEAIERIGAELTDRRKVKVDAYVLDDGWDDFTDPWRFDAKKLPNGFKPLAEAARRHGSALGTWISIHGGYGTAKAKRVAGGARRQMTLPSPSGRNDEPALTLLNPAYRGRVGEMLADMVDNQGVIFLKGDGLFGGFKTPEECDLLLGLFADLRRRMPHFFLNTTSQTWQSPFWLLTSDTIWRQGGDTGWAGIGPRREMKITYLDANTYRNVVQTAPLFPLNSVVYHGIIWSGPTRGGECPDAFGHEVWDYFGNGTQSQELYGPPDGLNAACWTELANAANWSRRNAAVLVDTHWVGGDPSKLEVYGWAAWSPAKGILTLRCPNEKPGRIELDAAKVFELPAGAPRKYRLRDPRAADGAAEAGLTIEAGKPHTFELAPFDVLVFEATPAE